ncbi:uncharacterized protein PFL1_02709 [Pseudozyma flocculosa PF-1]|uniref:KOW domain-containing protein n=2 Tax=Pseudozyma flocculosa TaxID=84751 RepID=A0A061HBS4_9BASI|nr:uncharacterized protein PFL1_02709 [Pseudozyma flocculosa PF-1]EPQ29490.1 hypothetical protein PFL1_02709 [Pseudozyma flocculosa PF-1]SPO38023.1 probable RPL14B - ribosomal protein [Pseudozyma flocculosa]
MGAQSFKRYVETGRVVLINDGPNQGKLAVVAEIIDHNRAIIDGPQTGVERQAFPYKHLTLTPLVVKGLPRGAGSAAVKKYFEKENILERWASSAWAKKLAAVKTRRAGSDFDRFQVAQLKKQRRHILVAKKASA